jgi:hypothetical protein
MLAVYALCRKDANLLTAGAVIKFMIGTLGNENSEIARELQTGKGSPCFTEEFKFIARSSQCLPRLTLINQSTSALIHLQIAQSEL